MSMDTSPLLGSNNNFFLPYHVQVEKKVQIPIGRPLIINAPNILEGLKGKQLNLSTNPTNDE